MIIGGQAVLLYGEPRLTNDIDITLGIGINKLEKIKTLASKLKFKIIPRNADKFARDTYVLPVIDKKTNIRIDFIFSFSSYEKNAIKRARKIKMGGSSANFASLEDIIIHKIIAGRVRDLSDVKVLLFKNPHYNRKYILKWLREFDNSLKQNYTGVFKRLSKNLN